MLAHDGPPGLNRLLALATFCGVYEDFIRLVSAIGTAGSIIKILDLPVALKSFGFHQRFE
ncbi:hypothetical protein [Paraburkholderia adhaesiva]|uniref:hypothetical protein n=1 Tax=Paraburkholderia adhaesiva TaxID=2883244 RepID=UPI001F3B335E|nr:hypothetical protein [Paraburkholderia adhaesiva]